MWANWTPSTAQRRSCRREFDEDVDRICRELDVKGADRNPSFHTDEFILKITVHKVTEKVTVKVTENGKKGAENKKKALAGST